MRESVDAKPLRGRRLPLSVIRDRRRFVTAGQDRVVQIRRVGFSGIKGYDYSLTPRIYPDVAHSRDAHERFAQFADAFIAIFSFRRDRDSLQHRFVWSVRIMRVRWIEMLGIEWLDHPSIYAPSAALSSRAERGTSPMVCNIRISNSHRRQSLLTRDISQSG
jgi:hypothetical protein